MDTLFDLEPDDDDHAAWHTRAWTAVLAEARTGRSFTIAEAARKHNTGEPPNTQADWGQFTLQLKSEGVIEHCGWSNSTRPSSNGSGVKVWRGTAHIRGAA